MSFMPILWIVLGGVTVIMLILIAYRGTLTRYEEDQIFLDDSGKNHEMEQSDILMRVQKVDPYVRLAIGATCLMSVFILGIYVWDAVTHLL